MKSYVTNFEMRRADPLVFDTHGHEDAHEELTFQGLFVSYSGKHNCWVKRLDTKETVLVHCMYVRALGGTKYLMTQVEVEDTRSEEELLKDLRRRYQRHRDGNKDGGGGTK